MKKYAWFLVFLPALFIGAGAVFGDNDHSGRTGADDDKGNGWWRESRLDVAPVRNEPYQSECGSCHFAYQPGLLPARSWQAMMGDLANHFGDNAELDETVQQQILDYLVDNAADRSRYKRSRRIDGSLHANDIPLRISDTLYFKRKHHEIPQRLVKGNRQVGSFSNCAACHRRAGSGSYNEHEVNIPGVGLWDD